MAGSTGPPPQRHHAGSEVGTRGRHGVRGRARLLRFDGVQRAAHWANAGLSLVLVLTALPLYFPSVERAVGRHVLVASVHVWAGIVLPVPVLVSLVGPWGARMRRDLRRFNRWTRGELEWMWRLGNVDKVELDKFNPGQKLNAVFVGGAIVVFLATGVVMKWFGLFPVGWRTGATFVHEVLAWLFVVVAAGHIVMALTHREMLRSMVHGWVTLSWAQRHARRWAREELDAAARGEPPVAAAQAVPSGTD